MPSIFLRLLTVFLFTSIVSSVTGAGFAGIYSRTEATEVRICWTTAFESLYQVQYCPALSTDSWIDLGSAVEGTGEAACVTDSVSGGYGFYRVSQVGGGTNGPAIHATIAVSEVRICWDTAPTLLYQVQYPSNNVWIDAGPPVAATGSTRCVTEPITEERPHYRVVGPDVVWIPPGTFLRGSPETEAERGTDETQHEVTISQGFWMGKYEVTQEEYLEVTGANPSLFSGRNFPVDSVNWNNAASFCAELTEREERGNRLPAGYVYRLPTEAEWEYACRAEGTTAFHYGDALRSGMANFHGPSEYDATVGTINNPEGIRLLRPTAVGSYVPNAWGLYDMHGNMFEWCQDRYGDYPLGPLTDPEGPDEGSNRVIRGGNWRSYARSCRSAARSWNYHGDGAGTIGFRIVLAPGQPDQ